MSINFFKMIHLHHQIRSSEKRIKQLESEDNIDNLAEINSLQKSIDLKKSLKAQLEKPYNN